MAKIFSLNELEPATVERFSSGYPVLDVQFGGGIPRRKLSVWPGAGGTGKSRLWVQVTKGLNMGRGGIPRKVLYITGENPPAEFAGEKFGGYRSGDYFIARLFRVSEIVDAILQVSPDIVILDSVNSIAEFKRGRGAQYIIEGYDLDDGSRQIGLRQVAEQVNGHIVFLTQQNADGSVKGGTELGHWADATFYMNKVKGDVNRFEIRAGKNRYAASGTKSIWLHTDEGVEPVEDKSANEAASLPAPLPARYSRKRSVLKSVGSFFWQALSTPIR